MSAHRDREAGTDRLRSLTRGLGALGTRVAAQRATSAALRAEALSSLGRLPED